MLVSDAYRHSMWYLHISFALQSLIEIRTYKSTFVVSELFKQMVEKEKLKVGFDNTSSTFW